MGLLALFAAASVSSAAVAAAGPLSSPTGAAGAARSERAQLALPSAKQLDFQTNHEKGCFFHFGINTFTGQEHGTGDDKQPPSKFNAPADLSTDQWVEACVAMGGTYAVFTAKHEEGMMNWPSNATNYTIEYSPFCQARRSAGGSCDLVAEFLASCDKYNITRGLYYTVSNNHCRVVPSGGAPGNTTCNDMLRNAFTELATSYGPIGQFWFDHGNELFVDLVDRYQPGASIAGREWTLVGTEGGYVLNGPNSLWSPLFPMGTANKSENTWLAYQCDTSLSTSGWFWHNGAAPRYNASQAVDLYGLQCIGVGAGLILNLPPSTRGVIEPEFISWATAFATEWDRRFGPAASLGYASDTPVPIATDRGPANGAVTVPFEHGHIVDYVVIKEDLSRGQRIAGWELDIQIGQPDGQKPWHTVAAGSTIGSTRIIPLGMPGKGQFVPGQLCQGPQCHGAISNTFGVRFRPTISVANDGMVYVANLAAFNSIQH